MTTYTVSAGQTSSGIVLSAGDYLNVWSGGTANLKPPLISGAEKNRGGCVALA